MGDDNRTLITNTAIGPYCNTVYIETTYASTPNTVYLGTGFILGPSAVVTAAHCVYNERRGGYASTVKIIPAKNGAVEPYGSESVSVSADNVVVSTGFINSPGPDNDWAVIELSTDIGNTTGWLGLRWQSNTYNGTSVTNTGYTAIGILTSGSSDNTFNQEYPTAYSTATRIILEMYKLFVTYR